MNEIKHLEIPEGYYGMRDLNAILKVRNAAIHVMIGDGRLPKPGKHCRRNVWEKQTIDKWVEGKNHLTIDPEMVEFDENCKVIKRRIKK
jgi:predicted DNA-binding transcriptional regulator AlpA